MTLRNHILFASAVVLVACVDEDSGPEEAQLLVPDQISVQWDDSFNGDDDGLGALIPVDLMVYEGGTGEPLGEVLLDLNTTDGVEVVDDTSLSVLSSDCLDCVWDSGRDRYIDWENTTASVETDEDGLARVYLWVDTFSEGQAGGFDVEMGETTALVEITRQ